MYGMAAPGIEAIWRKVVESFSSKVLEQTVDDALYSENNARDFELIFKNLRKNLKSLSAKAADVEDEFMNRELSGQKKRKTEVKEWLEEVESIKEKFVELGSQIDTEGFVMRLIDGGKVEQLDKQVEKLVDQSRKFGELVLEVRSRDTILTEGLVGQAIRENLETILRLLESRQVSSIGVYGKGGVGKTTLAQHIYNRLMQQSRGCVFWVTVSQEFTVRSLQDKISRFLGVQLSDEDETGMRAMRLHTTLSEKKNSVLILDDVWENIDMKKVGCTFSVECCRLIITTRSSKVCDQIGCEKVHIEKLYEDEAWNLFNDTLGNEIQLGPQVEEIARSMAKLCDGLPLGIITIAGSMKGETIVHTWRNALAELKDCVRGQDETGEVDEVFKALRYCFDRLNRNYKSESNEFNRFQLCFLYCSLYPEDYEIVRARLVRKFISEGLVDERKSRRARVDQGHSILDKLVDVCLLENCVNDDGEKCVKMHDLVRSMALKICEGKYMVRAGDYYLKEIPYGEEWTKDLEKVSFMFSGLCGMGSIKEGLSADCPKLSTLLLSGYYHLNVIPESLFFKMRGLCTLDLSKTCIKMLPNSVSHLTCLKALLLRHCHQLVNVPYLGRLKALRELDLSGTSIYEVPQGLENLLNLEFLSFMDARNLDMIPSGLLLKLVHLRIVKYPFHIEAPIEGIQNLKLLEKFHGRVRCLEEFNYFIRSNEIHDIWYTIIVAGDENEVDVHGVRMSTTYKKKLGLLACYLEDERVLGHDTEYISICECEGLSISFLDDFPRLKALSIEFCGGIECILRIDGEGSAITLEEIELRSLYDLKGLVVMDRGEIGPSNTSQPLLFSSLRKLVIFNCNKMRKVGLLAVSGLPNLEVIDVRFCREMEEIFEEDEERAASILILPKLEKLTLEHLPRMKSVSKATIICNSIRHIHITKCSRLINKLPLHFDDPTPPPTLEKITVERDWWESLEWDINPNLPLLLQSFLHFW